MRVFVLLLAAFVSTTTVVGQGVEAPPLALRDLRGREIRLGDYRGKVVLLNFWATWCAPCRVEIPELVKLQRENAKRGLQVLGITYPPQKKAAVRSFVRRMRVNYPIALGTKRTKTLFTTSDVLPVTIVIDRDGTVKHVIEGILYPEEFDQKIKPLLNGFASK